MESVPEEWRDVKGYEWFYQVSNLGRVKSLARTVTRINGSPYSVRECFLVPAKQSAGYGSVCLHRQAGRKYRLVHKLVMQAFVGPCPEGHEVNHFDGSKRSNALSNLEYVTSVQNKAHAREMGLWENRGEHGPRAKLTNAQASEIRRRHAAGELQKDMAKEFGVSVTTMCTLIHGKIYTLAS